MVLASHDLRRTCANLCRGAGGGLEQIQMLLGHASLQTTERYLGSQQAIRVAVSDHFGIPLADKIRRRRAPGPATPKAIEARSEWGPWSGDAAGGTILLLTRGTSGYPLFDTEYRMTILSVRRTREGMRRLWRMEQAR
jgi:hypothetical protein